ncbi:MAG TPA: N-acetylmuramoyl-L-alanine amidase [Chthoniobacterales bacterium]
MNLHRFIPIAAIAGFMALASLASGQSRATVVIDAGHGGFDRGGVPGQRIAEKDKTLDVALRLRRILLTDGYKVIMTRDRDVFVTLGTRVAIANAYRNATFVSIHFNCSSRVGANGIETYYYRGDSAGLAASIHRNVVAGAPTENRGIRRRGFFVLRRTAIPSVLVECGFLTNPTEGRLAQTDNYRQKLAEQIARGIRRQPPPFSRPLTASLSTAGQYGPQPFNTGANRDFVRADAVRERSSRSSRSKYSKHRKSSKSSHHTTSRNKKKSSDDDDTPKKKKTRKKKSED